MPYNPNLHHRRSIRLKGYDYSQVGLYFITICCQDKICRFGKIENGEMILNEYGQIAYDEWAKLQERYPYISNDVFQIMPNHVHGIIVLDDVMPAAVGATLAVAPDNAVTYDNWAGASPAPTPVALDNAVDGGVGATLAVAQNDARNDDAVARNTTVGNIIGAYKSLVMNECLKIYKSRNEFMGKFWQRNFYEHIIRNEQSYQNISDYIIHNPENWTEDKFYIE
jgi:REP element-mobilizing transposase RayT